MAGGTSIPVSSCRAGHCDSQVADSLIIRSTENTGSAPDIQIQPTTHRF
jgi:hypothetical protein